MSPDQMIYLGAGALVVLWLYATFGKPKAEPMARSASIVSARVIDSTQGPPASQSESLVQLALQLNQMIDARGIALAFDRKTTEMVEQKAKSVTIPWVAATDPPKA